ncbi:efflux RND transporter periplasmic adaptor subunit [Inconstantimicrobium mannanitabidum]|uniref:Uncharacterized protein n=1 Tax=Inconstantimicrobium mannanitabidum TaxID=1604901 RepID=A0ACB5RD82_9CLOT|nr:efflux RND transporter periplasmic adaptor subunit [Clostridium sp. TW13]GKX67122.1 hypothetical protein rsdtw13_23800 [Clostridium sp. TW13]
MKKKVISVILAVVLIAGGIGAATYFYKKSNKSNVSAVQYTSIKVTKGSLENAITGSGSVESANVYTIRSGYKDTISEIDVSNNSIVNAGDTLIKLSSGNVITAGQAGIVSNLSLYVGENININQELMNITDNKTLTTKIQVDETDLPKIKSGQEATITLTAFPKETFKGKISQISNIGTYSNGVTTFDVTISFDDIKNIKIGMSTNAKIVIEKKDNVNMLPISTVKSNNRGKFVMVRDANGSVTMKNIETGISNETYVEVTKGLEEGDEVLIAKVATNTSNNSMKSMMQGAGGNRGSFGGSGYGRNGNGGTQKSGSSSK